MHIDLSVLNTLLTIFAGATLASLGFIFRKLISIDIRLARMEERMRPKRGAWPDEASDL